MRPIVKRFDGNPVLTKQDVPYPVETVHNAGVTLLGNRYILLFRAHLATGRSIIGLAESTDGHHFQVAPEPFLTPSGTGNDSEYDTFSVEDPRICCLDDEYLITYSAYSRHGVRIGLAKTTDFRTVEKIGYISQADMRNAVIFPRRFDGLYVRLDRPHSEINPWAIWISYSPDLVYWGKSKILINPVQYHWDEMKIGPGATPIETSRGWLNIFHGVFPTMDGSVYRLGVALHDLEDPARVLGVADEWILTPEDPWELTGYVHNVVFCCGAVAEPDGSLKLYWGGADTVLCMGTARINDLIGLCLNKSRPPI